MAGKKKPLWTCPKCGHRFVTPNMWHSCSNHRLTDHFKGKGPIVRQLFDQYVSLVRQFGPVTVYAQKPVSSFRHGRGLQAQQLANTIRKAHYSIFR